MKEEPRQRKKGPQTTPETKEPSVKTLPKPKRGKWCDFCLNALLGSILIIPIYLYFAPCPVDPLAVKISEVPPEMPPEHLTTLITKSATLKLPGAECFVVHEPTGYVYTGLANGVIARFKLELGEPEMLLRTGKGNIQLGYCAVFRFRNGGLINVARNRWGRNALLEMT